MDLTSKVATQLSAVAFTGLGMWALQRWCKPQLHPILLQDYFKVSECYPSLAACLSHLEALHDEDGFRRVVQLADRIRLLDDQISDPGAQWHIARMSTQMIREVEQMCATAPRAKSDEMFRAVVDCERETIPALRSVLDNILHNHILRRAI